MYCSDSVYQAVLKIRKNGRKQLEELLPDVVGEEAYIPTRSGETRVLLYTPDREGPLPVYFNVHGGGFIKGHPEGDDAFCQRVSQELGVLVVNIDYRLAPEYPCPMDKEDVYDVIQYLHDNPDEFGIDPDRLAVGGHSAGANISAVIAKWAKQKGDFTLRCQILDYPPMDVQTNPYQKFYTEGAIPPQVADLFNDCYIDHAHAGDSDCSPIYCTAEELSGQCPAILLTCEIDSLREEGEEYALKLMRAGVEVTARRFLGVPHGFSLDLKNPGADEAQKMMIDGLRKYL
jgi:acetyl esterase